MTAVGIWMERDKSNLDSGLGECPVIAANERAVSTVHVSEWCSSEVPKQEVRCICPSAVFQDQAECEMASTRRLQRELEDIQKEGMKNFRNLQVEESNMLCWQGLLVPDKAPYDKGAFKIEILFPTEYPFKPPKILFRTKIYHPNIDEKGQVCLSVISAENWKPATKVLTVIANLITLVNDPHPDHPLRADLAEEYTKDRKKFFKNAEEFTRKHAERRPADC
ncbi:hypothetical protein GJAV_G00050180 [Gymnothorax javanicus]|nr:hypothetical protein GJAV_G00050180 [Gymnothorax javanicus]